jgi:hypothetical protein
VRTQDDQARKLPRSGFVHLTSSTSCNQFMPITYIIKLKKANPQKMDLPLLKNDITTTKAASQNEIHCRYMEFRLRNGTK